MAGGAPGKKSGCAAAEAGATVGAGKKGAADIGGDPVTPDADGAVVTDSGGGSEEGTPSGEEAAAAAAVGLAVTVGALLGGEAEDEAGGGGGAGGGAPGGVFPAAAAARLAAPRLLWRKSGTPEKARRLEASLSAASWRFHLLRRFWNQIFT